MAYVNIDIDMSDLETYDLVEEVCRRLRREGGRKSLTDKQKQDLKENFGELGDALNLSPEASVVIKTLDDKMKYEHIANVWDKYSSAEIEKLLP